MGKIQTVYGEPSYTLKSDKVEVYISIQGGHLTASFKDEGKNYEPFFIPHWWNQVKNPEEQQIVNILRGDFFCFPFGANVGSYKGKEYFVHGNTANKNWEIFSLKESKDLKEIVLTTELDYDDGFVDKVISINDTDPVIYSKNIIRDFEGRVPLGNHPTLKFPNIEGAGIIDMSEPLTGFTAPELIEDPSGGGYSHLKPGFEIKDRKNVSLIDGSNIDLTRFPGPKGFDDIHMFVNDDSKEFCFSSVTVPEEGYLYFQLKDPKILKFTMLWMANCGRHFPPWNGKTTCLGLEEITGYFHYGIKESLEKNPILEKGFKTYVEISEKDPFGSNLIMGLIPVGKDFKGVKDIIKKDSENITIIGKDDQKMVVPCKVGFLRN